MKTPHKDKLVALFNNPKLPQSDLVKKDSVFGRYEQWLSALRDKSSSGVEFLDNLVKETNSYKNFIDLDFIFGSENDFLYRQKGQLKLDNTVLEECLPYLVDERLVPGAFLKANYFVGDENCYAGLFFGNWNSSNESDSIFIKGKNQDFAVGRKINLTIDDGSHSEMRQINVAYFAAELKTNLDKTMFQEASATARELKANVSNSKYFLVCEWLDMTPIDSATTSIDAVVVLRRAKRLSSNIRSEFSTFSGRRKRHAEYRQHLEDNPLDVGMFKYLVEKLNEAVPTPDQTSDENKLTRGYF